MNSASPSSPALSTAARASSAGYWVGLYVLIAAAWIALYVLSLGHISTPLFGVLDSRFDLVAWQQLCRTASSDVALMPLIGMWTLMTLAMMLPSALPFLRTYQDIAAIAPGNDASSRVGVTAGYLTAWLGFSLLAALAQGWGTQGSIITPHGIIIAGWAGASLLLIAGAYQLSPLKRRALAVCRQPMQFLFLHWRSGHLGAGKIGLLHGLHCVACCWALMLLGFVAGTMNMLWMGLATLIMGVEKLGWGGNAVTRCTGFALLAAGLFLAGKLSGTQ